MLNILIADSNINLVELIFKEIIRKDKKFRLADYTYNEENALKSILQYRPDVIILEFKMTNIIEHINSLKEEYYPYIILISDNQEYFNKIYNKFYAINTKNEKFSDTLYKINKYLEEIYKEIKDKEVYGKIKKELKKFKINSSNKGTDYLIDTILLSYNKENLNLTQDVYPVLSKKYQVTPQNIKWNMEKNLKSMKRYTENDIITNYFYVDSKTNLTIKTVVRTIADNINYR